jgi:DNA topoisomerase IB
VFKAKRSARSYISAKVSQIFTVEHALNDVNEGKTSFDRAAVEDLEDSAERLAEVLEWVG